MAILNHLSVEFFPPKTDTGREKLTTTIQSLSQYNPDFFSVTYGAGGSIRNLTYDTIKLVQQSCEVEAAPHLSCIGADAEQMRKILSDYKEIGVKRIVALRGDLPSGSRGMGEFKYASDLVTFIQQEFPDTFSIEVAAYPECHPQSANWQEDIQHFQTKVNAGADSAITQYFFNVDCYFALLDDCEKSNITIPIIPGIMPITNSRQLIRFSDMCGTEIPRWIKKRLEYYDDDIVSIKKFGEEVITNLCQKLVAQGVDNLHFYAMNQSEPTIKLWDNLGLPKKQP
jgi:methylenetetrahydrofolate reductase (NADPH)